MEQTALRPKSLPGSGPAGGSGGRGGTSGTDREPRPRRRPHAARRRGRRLVTWLTGLCCAVVLVLAGIGLGTVGTGVIALSRMAEMREAQQAVPPGTGGTAGTPGAPGASGTASARQSGPAGSAGAAASPARSAAPGPDRAPARAGLGLEVVDAPGGPGALVVAVHVPGPGYTAGLVRGDVLLRLGADEIGSASDLAARVADARPGRELRVKVRHGDGGRQDLTVVPGVVT
ncbi:PDZ domain-containing protein [Streptomyces sp. NPDC059524]|uniref:PDZ domain-containing protein n=1 Tax=Streptomyces sp. NPDC059524 TaxID=3346856 RepID=UPI00369102BC